MATIAPLRRISSSAVRQQLAEVLNQSQQEPIEIMKGGTDKGKAIAVLVGHSKFEAMRQHADKVESTLRELSTHQFTGSADAQLEAFRQRLRKAIAEIHPKPQYTLAELLSRADGHIPVDRAFLDAPRLGGEAL